MKKILGIISFVISLCLLLTCFAVAEEAQLVEVQKFSGEDLSAFAVEGVSAINEGVLSSLPEGENTVAQPTENAIGYSHRMFGKTFSMWGWCVPHVYTDTKNLKVVLNVSLHSFDEVNWTVNPDGFLSQINGMYSGDILGYKFDGIEEQWITGPEYNAAEVKYNQEKDYYYKSFEFTFKDIPVGANGMVWMEWDQEATYMSIVTHSVAYYDAETNELIGTVDEEDCAYGTLDNLTGIVATDHTYSDLSCGEPLIINSYKNFAVMQDISIDAGEYVLQFKGDIPQSEIIVFEGDTVVISREINTDETGVASVAFDAAESGKYTFVLKQLDDAIQLTEFAVCYEQEIAPPVPTVVYGDMDGNGKVTASDALIVLQIAVNKIEATEKTAVSGNVDGKGEITASDALLVLQKAVNKITSFPVEQAE